MFTKAAIIGGWVLLVFGALNLLLALALIFDPLAAEDFPNFTSGGRIDRGLELIFYGIVLGAIGEIGRALKEK